MEEKKILKSFMRKPHKRFDRRDLFEIVTAALLSSVFTLVLQVIINRLSRH